MPIILTPLHFDRDPLQKQPSCRRSVVIRTFITSDFMTGIPAMPGNHIPEEVLPDPVPQLGLSILARRYLTTMFGCNLPSVLAGGAEDGE